ncbi:MAG: hypothetical protein J6J16_09605 [Lachnospiraceae bacterium]|nr:hypothetical protein [Lachnospiraceae bacterium]
MTANTVQKTGVKHDEHKNRLDLIEPEFIEGVGEVLTFGAEKYEPNSWQKVEDAENRYYAALFRHLMAYKRGETVDQESGLSHLKHIACNAMFLLHFEEEQ